MNLKFPLNFIRRKKRKLENEIRLSLKRKGQLGGKEILK